VNGKALGSLLCGLLALGALLGGPAVARASGRVGLAEAIFAIPVGALLAFVAILLARRAALRYQLTLGRAGGKWAIALGRGFALTALLLALTGVLALGVYAVLEYLET
jgi:hypothetical protein